MVAQRFLRAAQLIDKECVLKCCCGIIRSHGKQLLIDLVGKIGAITRHRNETPLAIYANGNYNSAAGFLDPTNIGHDFRPRNLNERSETLLQPFRESLPAVSRYHLDRRGPCGIAQAHKSEIQLERSNQQIGEVSGNGRRLSPYPRLWDHRKCKEIPDF